jgi:ferredoxin-NADP reductase
VRELGDFTERVKDIPSGTPVFIEGPYGVFTNRKETSSKVLLLAGGIGITPLRTLAEEMGALGKDVLLLYGSRTRKEVVFKEELDVLSEKYQIRVIHVLSQGQGSLDERGYIDEEKVKRLVPDLTEREIYLCGPVQMVNTISAFLLKNGVKQENIYFERFSLHA